MSKPQISNQYKKMRAKQFIQVALIDQMQQIADLGLWLHLAKLIPPGVEVLARVYYSKDNQFVQDGFVFLPESIERLVSRFYGDVFPGGYHHFPTSTQFFSRINQIWLTSSQDDAGKHLTFVPPKVATPTPLPPEIYIHIPQWFEDFKSTCKGVIAGIERGELEDIEIFNTLEK